MFTLKVIESEVPMAEKSLDATWNSDAVSLNHVYVERALTIQLVEQLIMIVGFGITRAVSPIVYS